MEKNDTEKNILSEKIKRIIEYEIEIMNEEENEKPFSEGRSKIINVPIDIDENHTVYLNTITENGNMLPYCILYPKNMEENAEPIVNTLNTRNNEDTDDRVGTFIKCADTVAGFSRANINAPMIYIFIPKTKDEEEAYYQQLSRECFTDSHRKYDRIDLMVKSSTENAQNKIENLTGKKLSEKVTLCGYSTSGVFAQRFAIIHPEIVSKAIIGGAAGSIPIPNNDLEYPVGIKDYKELFGKEFDEEAYKKIDFAYFVGELEAKEKSLRTDEKGNQILKPMHDMSYLLKSTPIDIGSKQRQLYGDDLNSRFINSIKWYEENEYKIVSKIYKEGDHQSLFKKSYKYIKNFYKDVYAFYKNGISGIGFQKDESSAEQISMNCLDDMENQKEI